MFDEIDTFLSKYIISKSIQLRINIVQKKYFLNFSILTFDNYAIKFPTKYYSPPIGNTPSILDLVYSIVLLEFRPKPIPINNM